MSRLSFRSTCNTSVAASLVLTLLARAPFADGLLLHDHSDHGAHSHIVTLDDLREGDLRASWHRHHDEDGQDNKNDGTDRGEQADAWFIIVSAPPIARGIHCSSSAVIATILQPSPRALPRLMLPSGPTDSYSFSSSTRPSAHALRPALALDALLQSSHALLL